MQWSSPSGRKLVLEIGDITRVRADAIVNAANSALAGGGGVDGAIHRAGGPSIMRELDRIRTEIGHCETGNAVVTSAGNLEAQYVFHAVGPIYREGAHGEPAQLAACYANCLRFAEERKLRTMAFPSISTGVYRFPVEDAAAIAIGEVTKHLSQEGITLEEVKFVLFDRGTFDAYARALAGV